MKDHISREDAFELLKKYNKDSFHIQHALTVEGVMKWYADELGYGEDAEYWGIVGLLHDIDFELYPDQHCIKAPELLREGGVQDDIIHAVCSHGYGITVDIKPEHEMEKVLFAADELTGLIWAAALMRPSKSVQDMEVKSVKKKFKSANFAAGFAQKPYKVVFYNFENLFDTINDPGVNDTEFTPEGPKKWNSYKYNKKIGNLERVLFDIASADQDFPIVIGVSEIENRSVMEDVLKQYDGAISLYDDSVGILKKIHSADDSRQPDVASDGVWNAQHTNLPITGVPFEFEISFGDLGIRSSTQISTMFTVTVSDEAEKATAEQSIIFN